MKRLLLGATSALAPVVLAASPAASAAGPQPPDCPLYVGRPAVDHPLLLPDGSRLVARDPYGGLLARNRLFFDFSVRDAEGRGVPRGIAQVSWALDGRVVRVDPTPPYQSKGLSRSRRLPAGDHRITVTVTPRDGTPGSTTFALTATDCQPASALAVIDDGLPGRVRERGSLLHADSSYESAQGPTMRSVAFSSPSVVARLPAAARGRAAGRLRIYGPGRRTFTLRTPRAGTVLLLRGALRVGLHPGARRFLTVGGLPPSTRQIDVELVGRGAARLLVARPTGPRRCYRVTARIAGPQGSVRADAGGLCRAT
jgi:hypothetical protein